MENGCHSIGFPLLSAGIFGYPAKEAWQVAIRACLDYFNDHPEAEMQIVFADLADHMLALGQETLRALDPA